MQASLKYPFDVNHGKTVLTSLEQQREEGSLCDVTLRVEGQDIHAHKGILSVCSDYFSAMFNGSYREKDSKVIDLSATFTSAKALNSIISSMYLGNFNINQSDDICALLEAASILMFPEAKQKAVDCLIRRHCLRNGLKFWFFADQYLDEKPALRFSKVLDNHFHDYYINQDEMSQLSARELLMLFQKQFHVFCTPIQLLEILLRSFAAQREDDCLTVLCHQILDKIQFESGDPFGVKYKPLIREFLVDPDKLSQEFGIELDLCKRFQTVLTGLLPDITQDAPPKPLSDFTWKTVHSDMISQCAGDIDVILTIAPTPHVLEQKFHLYMDYNKDESELLPLFHVSVYVPEIRAWLQLGQISSPPYLTGDKLTDYFGSCMIQYCNGLLYFIGEYGEKNMSCNVDNFQWLPLPPISHCHLTPSTQGEIELSTGHLVYELVSTKQGFFLSLACQRLDVLYVGMLELKDPGTEHAHWEEKISFQIPPFLFGFSLMTACHCVRDDRFVFVLFIGRMRKVHCRATCLAKYDLQEESVEFLCVPEEYLIEPYHWTLFEQTGRLFLAHKTTFMYRLDPTKDKASWENCSELITINGSHKIPSLFAKSHGQFGRLNGVAASDSALWVMAEKRLVDRWHSVTLWEIQVNMENTDVQQEVIRHLPSPYSCFSLSVPVKLSRKRLQGLELCQCVHVE